MGSAAELCGEIPHLYHADRVAVLFTEQSHSPGLFGLLQAHNIRMNLKTRADFLIYYPLHLPDLFRSHGGEMSKVKTQPVACHKGAGLLYMLA